MRVYVAGKWEEKARVREVMDLLKENGHTITYDWTQQPDTEDHLTLREQAQKDMAGIIMAQAFVGIFEKDLKYSGALSEMGAAIILGMPVYLLGPYADSNIFTKLANVHRGLRDLLTSQ